MRRAWLGSCVAVVLAAVAAPAWAVEGVPMRLVDRPITLPRGVVEAWVPVNVNLADGSEGEPTFLNPSVHYGVTDRLTVGLRHFLGVCVTGDDGGCPEVYDDASLDALYALARRGNLEIALGAALNVAPISDPTIWSADARIEAQLSSGPVAIAVSPTVGFALNDRDATSRRSAITFDLSVYDLVVPGTTAGNREVISVPVTVQVQVTDPLALFAGASLDGPLDPPTGDFSDAYTVPAAAGFLYAVTRDLELGASVTFPNLWGNDGTADERVASVFLGIRR